LPVYDVLWPQIGPAKFSKTGSAKFYENVISIKVFEKNKLNDFVEGLSKRLPSQKRPILRMMKISQHAEILTQKMESI
jgi:hypothetical protein